MSLVTVRPHLLRVHRWTAIGLAPVLLVVILSGLVLSFEPILSDLDARADRSAGVNADALKALVARLAGAGRITSITAVDSGRSLDVASATQGLVGRYDLASGRRTGAVGAAPAVFRVAEGLHGSLLSGSAPSWISRRSSWSSSWPWGRSSCV